MERLDKILSNLGYSTRRQCDHFLKGHSVQINGVRTKDPSVKTTARDITIDNEAIDHPDGIFILMNKPAGYVCSHDSADGLRIYDLLPEHWMYRSPTPSTIGRLDKDTTGVILITDQTQLNHQMSSPKRTIDKVYHATVDKPLTDTLIGEFASGTLMLADEPKPCLPAKLTILDQYHAEIVLHEGKYHQVKRMFEKFDINVLALHRTRFGEYTVENIEQGTYIDLPVPEKR
jgi:16S rRNA pseudouridine516 synthase